MDEIPLLLWTRLWALVHHNSRDFLDQTSNYKLFIEDIITKLVTQFFCLHYSYFFLAYYSSTPPKSPCRTAALTGVKIRNVCSSSPLPPWWSDGCWTRRSNWDTVHPTAARAGHNARRQSTHTRALQSPARVLTSPLFNQALTSFRGILECDKPEWSNVAGWALLTHFRSSGRRFCFVVTETQQRRPISIECVAKAFECKGKCYYITVNLLITEFPYMKLLPFETDF